MVTLDHFTATQILPLLMKEIFSEGCMPCHGNYEDYASKSRLYRRILVLNNLPDALSTEERVN